MSRSLPPRTPWDPTSRPEPRPPPPRAAARPAGTSDVEPETNPSPIGKTFGNYRILSVIQRGGMGEIFLGEVVAGPRIGEQVVLKRLKADFDDDERYRHMFGAEVQVTMRMDHPNIVKVFDAPTIAGKPCLAMEFVHGRNISQLLKRCRRLDIKMPPQVAVTIMLHILEGLSYAHALVLEDGTPLDLVHRDVTPGNILVSFDGAVKVTDFGIAKSKMSVVSTTVGVVKGTTRYLSPEQIRSQEVDGRTDLFSAATVLTEMLTGKPLFDRGAVPPTLFAIIKGERPAIADILPVPAPRLAAAIERALSVSPKSRFASAIEFADALRDAQRELGRPLAPNGLGRFVQELFGERPPTVRPSRTKGPEQHSLDLTYLYEVNEHRDLERSVDAPPAVNLDLEAELMDMLAGQTPLLADEFVARHGPPPPPPMSARIELPDFPDVPTAELRDTSSFAATPSRFPPARPASSGRTTADVRPPAIPSGVGLTPSRIIAQPAPARNPTPSHMLTPMAPNPTPSAIYLVQGPNPTPAALASPVGMPGMDLAPLTEPPARFPPPHPDEPQTIDLDDDRPPTGSHARPADHELILEALDDAVAAVERVVPAFDDTSAIATPPPKSRRMRPLFLAGTLCGALLVWGMMSFASRVVAEPSASAATPNGPVPASFNEAPPEHREIELPAPVPADLSRGAIDILRPRGARVRVDGIMLSKRVPIRDFKVDPGTRRILITKRRYRRRVELKIEAGQRLDITKDEFVELSGDRIGP